MELSRQKKIYSVYILLIIVSIFGYGIQKIYSFTLFPDEFGYWASAAKMAGYDWKDIVSLGSYYSFGYSFFLFPVLKIAPDSVAAYRIAVGLNMVLMCAALPLAQGIIKNLFPERDEVQQVFIAGIAVLYPSWIFYMQMTMTEALLMFLFMLSFRLFLALVKRPSVPTAVALAIAVVYLYCVHMRTLGVVIACMIAVAFWVIRRGKVESKEEARKIFKVAVVFFFTLMAALILAFVLKKYTIAEVFSQAGEGTLSTNNYGGLWRKLKGILNLQGLFHFVMGIAGKIFYLGLASFGFFYWAVIWCIRRIKDFEAALFLMLSVISEVLICSVYVAKESSIDSLIYGRYDEFLVPVLIVIGICMLAESRHPFRLSVIWGAVSGALAFGLLWLVEKEQRTGIRGYMAVGISYLINEDAFHPRYYFIAVWLFGIATIFLVSFFIWIGSKKMNRAWLMGVVLILETALGLYASHQYTYRYNETHFIDRVVAETIQEKVQEDDKIVYLKEDASRYIDAVQMWLGSRSINILNEDALLEEKTEPGEFLIAVRWTKHRNILEEIYDRQIETNTFILYYDKKQRTTGEMHDS